MKKQSAGVSGFFRIRVGLALTLTVAAAFLGIAAIAQAQKSGAATPVTKTAWPLLEDQLAQKYYDRAVEPGSALEALIRANQDFSILREAEATDKRGLPLWLRVYWRKAHPEGKYSADDPTGGYPHVLKEILEWMMTHQDLKATEDTPDSRTSQQDPDDATPGANVRISGAQTVARSESDVRINYFDPTKILSASNNIGGNGRQGTYYSADSGATWTQSFLPLTSPDTFHSDPTVDWTSDSRAWSSTLGIQGSTLRLRNYVSVDNGTNWTLDATVSGSQTSVDKQMVWVDHSASSPFKDQMYAIWHNGNPAFMNRRTAGVAGTWLAAPIQVSGAETSGTAIGGDVKTNSFGDVFGAWPATSNRGLFVVKSTNGGSSFGTPVLVATTFDGYDIGVPSFSNRRVLIYTSLGAYRTAAKNNVYLTWADLSGDAGCTAAGNEPGTNVASTCKTRIWFSRSVDGGATWSPRVKINNQAGTNDQFNPWMAVDETNGTIGIMYYDTVADAGRKKTDVWYQSSANDGVSWSTAVKVTTATTDESIAGADSGNQYGDYNALSAFNTVFVPSWTDRRSGAKEEIWTSKIVDSAVPTPNVVGGTATVSDGRVSPGQTATVSLCTQNVGSQNAANVVGTLQATGGVANPSSAQTYGAMTAGGPAVCKSFTFTVNPALPCGSSVTATLALQDGATPFTPASYTFSTGVSVTTSAQNFDSVVAPVLPAGWVASNASGAALWVTSPTSSDAGTNNMFVDDPGTVSDKRLETPGIAISAVGAMVSFRNNYNLEAGSALYDGGVLEVSSPNINAGAYTDILDPAVGGSFVSGGYSGTLSSGFMNPLAGRQAWSGNSGGYITTVANLGPNVTGQTIKLRFRMGSDTTTTGTGWRIDTLAISYPSCAALSAQQPVHQSNGHLIFQAIGYPLGLHTIEASSTPNAAGFGPIGTATADAAGNVQYDDADAVGLTTRFYRLKYP